MIRGPFFVQAAFLRRAAAAFPPRASAAAGPSRQAVQASSPPSPAPSPSPGSTDDDERFMRLALALAVRAAEAGEVPVGAVLVAPSGSPSVSGIAPGPTVVASASNTSEASNDPTAHAEMACIREAARALGGWRALQSACLYVTLEPCAMCAGALLQARVGRVVWGAPSPRLGASGSWVQLLPREEGPGRGESGRSPWPGSGGEVEAAGPSGSGSETAASAAGGGDENVGGAPRMPPHAFHPESAPLPSLRGMGLLQRGAYLDAGSSLELLSGSCFLLDPDEYCACSESPRPRPRGRVWRPSQGLLQEEKTVTATQLAVAVQSQTQRQRV